MWGIHCADRCRWTQPYLRDGQCPRKGVPPECHQVSILVGRVSLSFPLLLAALNVQVFYIYWTRHENEFATCWLCHPSGQQLPCPINIQWFTECVSQATRSMKIWIWRWMRESTKGSVCATAQLLKASQHCVVSPLGPAVRCTGCSNGWILVDMSSCIKLETGLTPGTRSISVSVITASPLVDHPLARIQVDFQ